MNIDVGDPFPSFEKKAWSGETISLSDLHGMVVVLVLYPQDNTEGCITEMNEFTKLYDQFTEYNAEVIGISTDDAESHEAFAKEHDIAIPLVTDHGGKLAQRLGIADDTGRAQRATIIIDRDGAVAATFEQVAAEGHAAHVLSVIQQL